MARTAIQNANASLVFNAAASRIDAGTDFVGTGDVTVTGWFKLSGLGGGNFGRVYDNGNSFFFFDGSFKTFSSTRNGGGSFAVGSTGAVQRDSWFYGTFTSTSTGLTSYYLNGVVKNSSTNGGTPDAALHNAFIGNNTANTRNFAGQMKDLRIYNSILTITQITTLMNGGNVPGAVRIFNFNEGACTIAYDTSGNGNNGTITSGTWTRDAPSKIRTGVNGNLVFNGDFEIAPVVNVATTSGGVYVDGTAGGDSSGRQTIFGWFVWNYTTSWEAKFDTSVSHSGNASMKISTTATGSTVGLRASIHASSSFKQNNIPVLPNTSYTYSGWVKTNLVSGSATTGARLQFVTSTGTADVTTTTAVTGLVATQDWTQYTGTFTTAATARFITPVMQIVGNDGTGTLIMDAWFDDITLTPTTPTTRTATTGPYRKTVENLVTNGDFEYAPAFTAAQTSMSRWIDGTAAGAATVNDYGVRVIGAAGVSAQFDSGYLKLVVPANKWIEAYIGRTGYGAIPNYIPILPSTSYTVTMRMKTEYISGDALGARITVYVSDGAFGGVTSYATSYIKTTTDWTTYSVTFTTGATVRYARVACSTSTDTGAANLSMTAYYDDIVLTKTTPDARTTA